MFGARCGSEITADVIWRPFPGARVSRQESGLEPRTPQKEKSRRAGGAFVHLLTDRSWACAPARPLWRLRPTRAPYPAGAALYEKRDASRKGGRRFFARSLGDLPQFQDAQLEQLLDLVDRRAPPRDSRAVDGLRERAAAVEFDEDLDRLVLHLELRPRSLLEHDGRALLADRLLDVRARREREPLAEELPGIVDGREQPQRLE